MKRQLVTGLELRELDGLASRVTLSTRRVDSLQLAGPFFFGGKAVQINHHMSTTPTYSSWNAMLHRCYYRKDVAYKYYGGRGISVCEEWRHSFPTFLRDMGERPTGFCLDRIDNTRGYSKENCRWVSRTDSTRNTRQVKIDMRTAELIREMRAGGNRPNDIALLFNLHPSTVTHICANRIWRRS